MSTETKKIGTKLYGYLIMTRPADTIVWFGLGVSAAMLAAGPSITFNKVFFAGLVVYLGLVSGNFFNDIAGAEEDKINHPDRPLASGLINTKEAFIVSNIILTIGVALSLYINLMTLPFIIITAILSIAYNYIKKLGFISNIMRSLLSVLTFIVAGLLASNTLPPVFWLVCLSVFFIDTGVSMMYTIPDIEGDEAKGIKSVAVKYGVRFTASIATLIILIGIVSAILTVMFGMLDKIYIIFALAGGSIFLLRGYNVSKKPIAFQIDKMSKAMRYGFCLVLIGFSAGVLPIQGAIITIAFTAATYLYQQSSAYRLTTSFPDENVFNLSISEKLF